MLPLSCVGWTQPPARIADRVRQQRGERLTNVRVGACLGPDQRHRPDDQQGQRRTREPDG